MKRRDSPRRIITVPSVYRPLAARRSSPVACQDESQGARCTSGFPPRGGCGPPATTGSRRARAFVLQQPRTGQLVEHLHLEHRVPPKPPRCSKRRAAKISSGCAESARRSGSVPDRLRPTRPPPLTIERDDPPRSRRLPASHHEEWVFRAAGRLTTRNKRVSSISANAWVRFFMSSGRVLPRLCGRPVIKSSSLTSPRFVVTLLTEHRQSRRFDHRELGSIREGERPDDAILEGSSTPALAPSTVAVAGLHGQQGPDRRTATD